jgi:hypothetical protein
MPRTSVTFRVSRSADPGLIVDELAVAVGWVADSVPELCVALLGLFTTEPTGLGLRDASPPIERYAKR